MLTRPGVTTAPPRRLALVRLRLGAGPDRGDEAVLEQDPAVRVLRARVVHRDDVGACEQGLHGCVPYLCRVEVITPRSLDEALRLKAERPDARPIAGGTDLLVELNFDRDAAGGDPQPGRGAGAEGLVARERDRAARRRPHVHGGDAAAARRSSCPRSPRRRARSARRRSATAARSAATSAPPRRPATRCRRCSSRAPRSRSRACAACGRCR